MSDRDLPVCGLCGKPVSKSFNMSGWHHYYTEDFHGPCYWGKPGKPND